MNTASNISVPKNKHEIRNDSDDWSDDSEERKESEASRGGLIKRQNLIDNSNANQRRRGTRMSAAEEKIRLSARNINERDMVPKVNPVVERLR